MLLWREPLPSSWLPKVRANLAGVLVDHAHLERKAATTALNLEKYRELYHAVSALNAIAIEELQHFEQVLGLLKQALGAGQMPPSQVLLGLALIMTMLVMAPTAQRINDEALVPWRSGQITTYDQLWQAARKPLHEFMYTQIAATGNWSSLYMVMNYRGIDTSRPETIDPESIDMVTLIPAFVLSEMKVAFLMGFRVYLPFLVIDMVISALLISMSMMMLPPVLISLPFKLLLFVLVDGWQLVCGSLMTSFVQPGGLPPEALSGVLPATDAALRLAEQAAAVGPVGVLNAVRAGLV